ncbi:unnamed protein product [Adineta steineri]|uniref:Uncharacterized protein n=1 Tax=Adineta steineri TaxID=433720 RepID=A0A816FU74_9BILA|nr:unnamed protein product [Adineta steineri]CAF1666113.1 unnamed protein product [Adineta steineri]
MDTNDSSSWSSTLLSVIYGINTKQSTVTKTTPYALVFEQTPLSESDLWKSVYGNEIDDLIDLVSELSVDACSHSLISTPSRIKSTTGITTTPTKHFAICTVATDHYLATANKKIKLH